MGDSARCGEKIIQPICEKLRNFRGLISFLIALTFAINFLPILESGTA